MKVAGARQRAASRQGARIRIGGPKGRIARGPLLNEQIARALGTREATVKIQSHHFMQKMKPAPWPT